MKYQIKAKNLRLAFFCALFICAAFFSGAALFSGGPGGGVAVFADPVIPACDFKFTVLRGETGFYAEGYASVAPGTAVNIPETATVQAVIDAIDLGRGAAVKGICFGAAGSTLDIGAETALFKNGVYIVSGGIRSAAQNVVKTDNAATVYLDMTGGGIETGIYRAVENDGGSTLNVISGTFIAGTVIWNTEGTVNIYGGELTSHNYQAVLNNTLGKLNIYGGKLENTCDNFLSFGVRNDTGGDVYISGGTIKVFTGVTIRNDIGKLEITGGHFISSARVIDNYNCDIFISGGLFEADSNAVYNSQGYTVNISGGTIRSKRVGISNAKGLINITGGTVESIAEPDVIGACAIFNGLAGSKTVIDETDKANNPTVITGANSLPGQGTIYISAANGDHPVLSILGGTVTNSSGGNVIKRQAGNAENAVVEIGAPAVFNESAGIGRKYNGTASSISASAASAITGATLSYQWEKDGADVQGAAAAAISVTGVPDSGTYKLKAKASFCGFVSEWGYSQGINVTITRAAAGGGTVSIGGWRSGKDPAAPELHDVPSAYTDPVFEYKKKGAPDGEYSIDIPTEPGDYTVRARFNDMDNYAGFVTPGFDFTIKNSISGGAVAGIVIGAAAVLGLGAFAVYWFVIRKKKMARSV